MKYCGVYRIDIGNSTYIGRSVNIHSRLLRHKRELKNNKHFNFRLQRAFNKHGAIKVKVLVRLNGTDNERLEELEQLFIDKYGNCNIESASTGFRGGKEHPHFGKKGELNHNFGKKQSSVHIYKRAEAVTGSKNGMFGKTHTEKAKNSMSNKRLGNTFGQGENTNGYMKVRKNTFMTMC